MKNLLIMTAFHIRRIIKTPSILVIILIPLIGVGAGFLGQMQAKHKPAALSIVLEQGNEDLEQDLGQYGYGSRSFADELQVTLEELDKGNTSLVYHIPANYTQTILAGEAQPIARYSRQKNATDYEFELALQSILKEKVTQDAVQQAGLLASGERYQLEFSDVLRIEGRDSDKGIGMMITMLLLLSYILMNSSSLSSDLIKFKKNNALKRAIVSPNNNVAIALSFILAYAIVMLLPYAIGVLGIAYYWQVSAWELLRMLVVLCLTILLNLALALVLFRLFKDASLCQMVGTILWIIMLGMAVVALMDVIDIPLIKNICYLSPLTWLIEILDKQQLFPGTLIIGLMISLMGIVGSYKLEQYVNT